MTTSAVNASDIDSLLNDTERFLRPLPNEELLLVIHELESRGLTQAARDLRSRLKTEELVRILLQMGQPSAALELTHHWLREDPENSKARILEVVAYYAARAGWN